MQVTHTVLTLAGEALIGTEGEFVTFNGALLSIGDAQEIAKALCDEAARANWRKVTREARYKRQTEAHARQLLASVQ